MRGITKTKIFNKLVIAIHDAQINRNLCNSCKRSSNQIAATINKKLHAMPEEFKSACGAMA